MTGTIETSTSISLPRFHVHVYDVVGLDLHEMWWGVRGGVRERVVIGGLRLQGVVMGGWDMGLKVIDSHREVVRSEITSIHHLVREKVMLREGVRIRGGVYLREGVYIGMYLERGVCMRVYI